MTNDVIDIIITIESWKPTSRFLFVRIQNFVPLQH